MLQMTQRKIFEFVLDFVLVFVLVLFSSSSTVARLTINQPVNFHTVIRNVNRLFFKLSGLDADIMNLSTFSVFFHCIVP